MMYELLIGLPPFYHEEEEMCLQFILQNEIIYPKKNNLSSDCMDLIFKLLQKEPEDRPKNL